MNHPVLEIARRELYRIGQRKSTRNLLIFIPLIVFIFLGLIYVKGALRDVPVAVYDADNSHLSRTLLRYIDASLYAKIEHYVTSEDEIAHIFLDYPDIHALYYIPKGLEKNILLGQSEKIKVYTNSTNIVYGNLLYKDASTITMTISVGIMLKKFLAAGFPFEKAMSLALPVKTHAHPLFNPYYNYLYYLLPGLMTVLLQMLLFFAVTRSINSEFNENTFHQLSVLAKYKVGNIIIGKTLAYFLMGLSLVAFIFVIYEVFGIPIKGSLLNLLLLFSYFIIATIVLAMLLSSIVEDEILAMDIAFFYNSPAFVFSGFTFPMFAMPFFDSVYAKVIPYTHFLYAFFKLYQMGTPLKYILPELLQITVFLLIGAGGSYIVLKRRFAERTQSIR